MRTLEILQVTSILLHKNSIKEHTTHGDVLVTIVQDLVNTSSNNLTVSFGRNSDQGIEVLLDSENIERNDQNIYILGNGEYNENENENVNNNESDTLDSESDKGDKNKNTVNDQ